MKNIYEVFAEHIREHIKNNNNPHAINLNIEILSNSLISEICSFCKQTRYQVYKTETEQRGIKW